MGPNFFGDFFPFLGGFVFPFSSFPGGGGGGGGKWFMTFRFYE